MWFHGGGDFFPLRVIFFKETAIVYIFILQNPHKIPQRNRHNETLVTHNENL